MQGHRREEYKNQELDDSFKNFIKVNFGSTILIHRITGSVNKFPYYDYDKNGLSKQQIETIEKSCKKIIIKGQDGK